MLGEIRLGANVVTVSRGRVFMVGGLDGSIVGREEQGLFAYDVRLLSDYRYRVNGRPWVRITSAPVSHRMARFEFTNPPLAGDPSIPKHVLGLTVERAVGLGVYEDFTIVNYHRAAVRLAFEVELRSDFADLFEVRRNHARIRRRVAVAWDDDAQTLRSRYDRQGYRASFDYRVARADSRAHQGPHRVRFDVALEPGGRWCARVELEGQVDDDRVAAPASRSESHAEYLPGWERWHAEFSRVRASDEGVERAVRQSADDLLTLRLDDTQPPDTPCVLSAGVPWFVALFGRDSLIAGLQTLPLHRAFALGALQELGARQATVRDDFRDADPGKILHELRTGELARRGLIPHTPYYGTADATLLYPILLHEAYLWTGDRGVLDRHFSVAERCLEWMDRAGDLDGDGFQEYLSRSPRGIKHQGWKDSGDGTVDAGGREVEPPVALCELQGYAYDARLRMAALYDVLGLPDRAGELRSRAEALAERFNDAFWLEEEGTYAFGLGPDKRPIASVVSNAGHCLWSGIAPPDRARRIVERLHEADMWSGWGIRTLSARHPAFNPFAYQRGAVWPHDNAIIAAGCRRYGAADAAGRIARGIFDSAGAFARSRLPELMSGLARADLGFPVPYLEANLPQAWAAGSTVALVAVLLGLRPDAPSGRLCVCPALPPWLDRLEVEHLAVGAARVSLRCWREGTRSRAEVVDVAGTLRVDVVDEWMPAREAPTYPGTRSRSD